MLRNIGLMLLAALGTYLASFIILAVLYLFGGGGFGSMGKWSDLLEPDFYKLIGQLALPLWPVVVVLTGAAVFLVSSLLEWVK